jgi:hypothetical protein
MPDDALSVVAAYLRGNGNTAEALQAAWMAQGFIMGSVIGSYTPPVPPPVAGAGQLTGGDPRFYETPPHPLAQAQAQVAAMTNEQRADYLEHLIRTKDKNVSTIGSQGSQHAIFGAGGTFNWGNALAILFKIINDIVAGGGFGLGILVPNPPVTPGVPVAPGAPPQIGAPPPAAALDQNRGYTGHAAGGVDPSSGQRQDSTRERRLLPGEPPPPAPGTYPAGVAPAGQQPYQPQPGSGPHFPRASDPSPGSGPTGAVWREPPPGQGGPVGNPPQGNPPQGNPPQGNPPLGGQPHRDSGPGDAIGGNR